MDSFLESCVILGLVKDEGGTETTKTKTKKDIDAFVLTEAELKESFESVATSCYPEHPMEEIIFRTILSSYHFLHKCLRHGLDTNQKSIVFDENEGCFWDSRVDDDKYFVKDMTLFATKLKSIGLEKNDEIKLYIEKFCSQDDRDRAEKKLMYISIETEYLVPLEVSDNDNDNDGAGADNNVETGGVIKNNNNNNNGSSSSSSSSSTTVVVVASRQSSVVSRQLSVASSQ